MATKLGVIGGGAWGTALANMLAEKGCDTVLWCREPGCAEAISTRHENVDFLPGYPLNPKLKATSQMSDMAGNAVILMVTPAQYMRATLKAFSPYASKNLPVILCSKGIELGSLCLMSDVLNQELPDVVAGVLTGPSFAKDIILGLPTAVTLACEDAAIARQLAELVSSQTFRPYISGDITGAEIGGAVKNVLAIAAGITLGMGLGRSAHAALITRGFAEMSRLGMAMGADVTTLIGLCGLGDLVLTCSSETSRNMSCGLALGKGERLADILGTRSAVTEGVSTAPAIRALSRKLGITMPICDAVADIVEGKVEVKTAFTQLMSRPLRRESL